LRVSIAAAKFWNFPPPGGIYEVDMASDEKWLEEALAGDEHSFSLLYRARQGAIYRFALHMSGDPALAEDTAQEVFLALLERGNRYDPARGTLLAFLYGIARHLVLRRLEKLGGDAVLEELAVDEDLLDDLTRRETIESVRRAVISLPLVYREALVLFDLEGASYEETAAALDCPIGTVRSRLSRGRAMLAQKLKPEGQKSEGNTVRSLS
jgi:RNA polymerase sigma-70 factor (ECF subfamily)